MGKLRDVLTAAEAHEAGIAFETHRRFIETVAIRHAPSLDHVPDIVQAVGVQICRGLNGFQGKSRLTTWLYRVTVNTARSYAQREIRQDRVVESLTLHRQHLADLATPPSLDDQVTTGERLAALGEAIDRLRGAERAAVRNLIDGPSVLPGSKATRHRARVQLKQLLADDPRLGKGDRDRE